MGDGAKECLQLRIDLKQQYPRDKAPLSLLLHSIKVANILNKYSKIPKISPSMY